MPFRSIAPVALLLVSFSAEAQLLSPVCRYGLTSCDRIDTSTIDVADMFRLPLGSYPVDVVENLRFSKRAGRTELRHPGAYTNPATTRVYRDGWFVYTQFNSDRIVTGAKYSDKHGTFHPGEDWNGTGTGDTDLGQPVFPLAGGRVIAINRSAANGAWFGINVVVVHRLKESNDLADYFISLYGHLDSIPSSLTLGAEVAPGDAVPIGFVGKTGKDIEAAHLHLEVRRGSSFLKLTNAGNNATVELVDTREFSVNTWPRSVEPATLGRSFISQHYCHPSFFIRSNGLCMGDKDIVLDQRWAAGWRTLLAQPGNHANSVAVGPLTPDRPWPAYDAGDPPSPAAPVLTGATEGTDGGVYFTAYPDGSFSSQVISIDANGEFRWAAVVGLDTSGPPAIGPDGTVYVTTGGSNTRLGGTLVALKPQDGAPKWQLRLPTGVSPNLGNPTPPKISADGTIYFVEGVQGPRVFSVSDRGSSLTPKLNWTFPLSNRTFSIPAIRPDGSVIVSENLGIVRAIRPDGSESWSTSLLPPNSAVVAGTPIAASDGSVVAPLSGSIFGLTSSGALSWKCELGESQESAAAYPDGTLLAVASENNAVTLRRIVPPHHPLSRSSSLCSPQPTNPCSDGAWVCWSEDFPGSLYAPFVIDSTGTAYVAISDSLSAPARLSAIAEDGATVWHLDDADFFASGAPGIARVFLNGALSLGTDGTLYVPGRDFMHAFRRRPVPF